MHWAKWAIILVATAVTAVHAQTVGAQNSQSALRGLRLSPSLQMHAKVGEHDMAAFLIADKIETDTDDKVILTGSAEVRRLDSVVKGDYIDYQQSDSQVRVRGNGLIMRGGSIVKGPSFDYNLNADTGHVDYPEFWFGETGGSGTADSADILSQQHMQLSNVQYSACPCPDPAWYIRSPDVDLRFDDNEGVARHGVLYFKDMPLLYSPWLSFPLKKERKSGFLLPTYGMSSKSGIDFSVPYYFNIAPNYDATVTPRILSKRGLQLGTQFRYLGHGYGGLIEGTYLPNDKRLGMKRWLLHAEHRHRLGAGFSASLQLNRVSDGDYFRDFSSFGLNEATRDHLTSSARLNWSANKYVRASLAAVKYQTLQDRTSRRYRTPQFDKLPELTVRASRYNWGGFDVVSENVATRFSMPHFIYGTHNYPHRAELAPYQSFDGTRLRSYTTLAYPVVKPGWYITPKAGLHMAQYNTTWKGFGPPGINQWDPARLQYKPGPRSQSRVLPIMSVDAGMTFERDTTLFGNDSLQTLEPRVYYLRVPYKDQSMLPVYDTSLATFNMAQAFDENIFSGGWDRIADANQLTVGLTSRWLDADTGFERLSLTAAQRIYFEDQRVTLRANDNPRTNTKSDYLVGLTAALTDTFNVRLDAQFNPESRERNRMTAGFRWEPKRLATVAASYRYDRDRSAMLYHREPNPDAEREQISVTAQWPLTNKWYAMGRYDYSIKEKRSTQSILGVEYKGDCCWAARVVMQRYAVSRKDVNTAMFFQLELSGLGSLGTDSMSLLRDRIAGYRTVTPPIPDQTTFERYE